VLFSNDIKTNNEPSASEKYSLGFIELKYSSLITRLTLPSTLLIIVLKVSLLRLFSSIKPNIVELAITFSGSVKQTFFELSFSLTPLVQVSS